MAVEIVRPLPLFPDEVIPVLSGEQRLIRRLVSAPDARPFGEVGSYYWLQERVVYVKGWVYDVDLAPCYFQPALPEQDFIPAALMPRLCSRGCVFVKELALEYISDTTEDDWALECCNSRYAFTKSWRLHYPGVHIKDNPLTWVLYIELR